MDAPGLAPAEGNHSHGQPELSPGLSLSQREVWLDQCAWPNSVHLNIGGGGFLYGRFDLALFKSALNLLVEENQALRLVPSADGGQRLLAHFVPVLKTLQFPDSGNPELALQTWWHESIREPFVLGEHPPWRFTLLRVTDELHGVSMQFHHMVMDGWGTSLVLQRWSQIYNALAANKSPLKLNSPDYLDFIADSTRYQNSEAFERDFEFWCAQFPALPEPLIVRKTGIPKQESLPQAHLVTQRISRTEYALLLHYATNNHVTPFHVFLAALALYFGRAHNRHEAVVGVPSLNRSGRRYRDTLGMFVGVMPILVKLSPTATLADLVASVSLAMRGALRHPRFPLSELGRKLEMIRSGRDGFFDLLLSFERQDYQLNFGEAKSISSRQMFSGLARYPLGVTVCEFHDDADVEMILEANPNYFEAEEAQRLGARLWALVQTMVATPDAELSTISLVPPAERVELLTGLHSKLTVTSDTEPFISLFERQAKANPNATALVWEGGHQNYAALNDLAEKLTRRLQQRGVTAHSVVAFAIARSPDIVIAILAIAKLGAAFLPLDPDLPVARIAEILAESAALALLIQRENKERLVHLHPLTIVVDEEPEVVPDAESYPSFSPKPHDMAYVLFTSGSTGRPKGVMVSHASLARRLAWLSKTYGVTAADRSAQATQITFDPSLIELCLPLIHGGSVALPAPGRVLPESLAQFALTHGVTIMAFVPSTLIRFLEAAANLPKLKLRVACCGGEVLSAELSNLYLNQTGARLYNVYGPTEATIFASAWACVPRPVGSILPIGSAVDDTRIYVLDENQQLLPFGAAGEIYLGGGAVALGYLNRPDLTANAFLADPFQPGSRMYRTGDRGWMGVDGNLNFLGRIDRQIKLRGYRIELGEIEAAILGVEGVSQAAVKLITHADKPVIHAWVATLANQSNQQLAERLQTSLRQRLPSYMIPNGFDILQALPQSSAGKIDYAALPEPIEVVRAIAARPPSSLLEGNLLRLWQDVLKQPGLLVTDNFFEIGGDSLAAVSILTGIEKLIGRRVPMYLITERPTVEGLASALSEDHAESSLLVKLGALSDNERVLQTGRALLYLAASGHGDLIRFKNLARALEATCELRMLQPPSASTVVRTVDLARLYVGNVVKQGKQAVYIAGFSVGGLAALETSQQLEQAGVEVKGLFLLDTIYPSRLWGGTFFWRLLGWLVRSLHIQDLSMNGRRLGAMLKDPGLVGQVMAVSGYRPSAFAGTTHLIKSVGLASTWDRLLFRAWRRLLGKNLIEHRVSGLHGSMFDDTHVGELAQTIADAIQNAPETPKARNPSQLTPIP